MMLAASAAALVLLNVGLYFGARTRLLPTRWIHPGVIVFATVYLAAGVILFRSLIGI